MVQLFRGPVVPWSSCSLFQFFCGHVVPCSIFSVVKFCGYVAQLFCGQVLWLRCSVVLCSSFSPVGGVSGLFIRRSRRSCFRTSNRWSRVAQLLRLTSRPSTLTPSNLLQSPRQLSPVSRIAPWCSDVSSFQFRNDVFLT